MKTADLIKAIIQDSAARQAVAARVAIALGAGGIVAVALFAYTLGVRPDIGNALQTWRFTAKLVIALVFFAAALRTTVELTRPNAMAGSALVALAVPVMLLAFALGTELVASPAASWSALAIGRNSLLCLTSITVLSVVPLAALLIAMREGAPRSPALAGAAAGLLAGGLAAVLYAIHCVDDSPLFVAVWYTLAIALVGLTGAALGNRALRW